MPKRNTTTEILENLTQGDIDASERKRKALAAIPAPRWDESIPINITYSDHDFNVRDEESYDDDSMGLEASLRECGLQKRGDSMVFHIEPSGKWKVLVGNVRLFKMLKIRTETIAERIKAGTFVGDDDPTLPFTTIFGLVYEGLTEGQQTSIMADHIGRKELNEYERCKEIGEFIHANKLTDEHAATHFGIDRNKITRYRMRWSMPTVMAEFKKQIRPNNAEPFIAVGQKDLTALYSAYMTDQRSNFPYRVEGPIFRTAWAKLQADPKAFRDPKNKPEPAPTTKAKKDLYDQIDASIPAFGDTPELAAINDALRFAAGEPTVNLATVRENLRDMVASLRAERDTISRKHSDMVMRVASLESERDELAGRVASLETDYASMQAERDELLATIAAKAPKNAKK